MKKILEGLLAVCLLLFSGCQKEMKTKIDPHCESSETLYVRRLDLPEGFIKGADVSSLLALEDSGVKFYDWNGEEADLMQVLAQSGLNYIRLRVWNHPYDAQGRGYGGGNNDIDTALTLGKRATEAGMKVLIDFHYSDFWADPGKQMVPGEWRSLSGEEKAEALYAYTRDSLQKLKDNKVAVGMVQIGNETNGAFCGETLWSNILPLMIAGSKAVREVLPEAKIVVHFANPESGSYENYASKLTYYGLDYDVFASSYYPYWHGTLQNLHDELQKISELTGKEVMVAETSYAYTAEDSDFFPNTIGEGGAFVKNYPFTVQGQANSIIDTMETVASLEKGIGLFYWEPAWITVGTDSLEANQLLWEEKGSGWASSYARAYDPVDAGAYYGGSAVDNQALFDDSGHPLESLKLFHLVDTGNEVPLTADAIEDSLISCDLAQPIVLPETVNAVMNDNSKKEVPVTWLDADLTKMASGGIADYLVHGEADGKEALLKVKMIRFNFLQNDSFEDGDLSNWEVIDHKKADQLYAEEKVTDSLSGNWHFHFWSKEKDSVDFDLQQSVELPAGTYRFSIAIMGGDAGEQDIYAYVRINGEEVKRTPALISGYNQWDTALIEEIPVAEGDSVTFGIHVSCSGEGNGAWGKIDDAVVNTQQ